MTSADFPDYFRINQYRVYRPLLTGIVALARELFVLPVLNKFCNNKSSVTWGRFPAITIVTTYFIWIILNIIMLSSASLLLYKLYHIFFNRQQSLCATTLMISTPIIILSIREISYGILSFLIAVISFYFWYLVLNDQISKKKTIIYSLFTGILFLGKLSASTFIGGSILLIFRKKTIRFLVISVFITVPVILWVVYLKAVSIPYVIADLQYEAGNWFKEIHSLGELLKETYIYFIRWIRILSESTGFIHLPFLFTGFAFLYKKYNSRFVLLSVYIAATDFFFYFLVHRAHAIYCVSTLIMYFAITGYGISFTTRFLFSKNNKERPVCSLLITLFIQFITNFLQLPLYAG